MLAGQPTLLEMLVHLWKEAVINMSFVLLGISDYKSIHVFVTQAIRGIIMDEVHARELASVLNTATAQEQCARAQQRGTPLPQQNEIINGAT